MNQRNSETISSPKSPIGNTAAAESYAKLSKGVDNSLIINPDKVIKKGVLYKKGNIFNRYKDQYLFYLE